MLKLNNINKKFGNFSLSGISLDIPAGEYFVLLGRSGSGKSQLLELIAGLKKPDSGEIWINNENVTDWTIQRRNIGLVFQDYAVFPNMTVYGNIAYALHCRKYDRSFTDGQVKKIADELNITSILNRYPENLSGGELQRVALARTLVHRPGLLLLDEPLGSIDTSLKDDIRSILRHLNRKGQTIVHVTHDYREAINLASRVGVIHNGRIIQEGKPDEVFSRPVNKFVARYAGIRNFFRVNFYTEGGNWKARCDGKIVFSLSDSNLPDKGLVIIRGNDIKIHDSRPSEANDNCISGIVREINPSEYGMEIIIDAGEIFYTEIIRNDVRVNQIRESSEVWMTFPAEAVRVLPGSA